MVVYGGKLYRSDIGEEMRRNILGYIIYALYIFLAGIGQKLTEKASEAPGFNAIVRWLPEIIQTLFLIALVSLLLIRVVRKADVNSVFGLSDSVMLLISLVLYMFAAFSPKSRINGFSPLPMMALLVSDVFCLFFAIRRKNR